MPRKAAAETSEAADSAEAPRRSTRISSQPGYQEVEATVAKPIKKAPAKKAAPAKKRTLDEDAGEESPESAEEPVPAKAKKVGLFIDRAVIPGWFILQAKVDKEEVPTLAPIDIGDSLPSFILKNEKDEDVDVSTLTAEKGLVLFLVPKANTRTLHFAVALRFSESESSWMQ